MNDRELLELAAKAAGHIQFDKMRLATNFIDKYSLQDWNPLTDDGDALRLAVKLRLYLEHYHNGVCCDALGKPIWEYFINDPYASTRRAIVRAAAEIGRGMT
jgi:transcription elongation factor GreA-like protein